MELYSYSLQNDFPAPHKLANSKLQRDIQDSSISSAVVSTVEAVDDAVTIAFNAALSAEDESTLDALIAAHTGVDATLSVVQLVEELTVDKATTSTTFMDLLAKTFVCRAGNYTIIATYSMANTVRGSEAYFQLTVDDVVKRGGKQCAAEFGAGGSGSLATKVVLDRGQHTVKLQWKVNRGAGAIRPGSRTDEHAFLEIREIV